MKKLVLVAVLFSSTVSFAQNSLIGRAQMKLDENKEDEALELIERALTSGKTKNMAGAYNMAGNVYGRILNAEILKASQNQPCDTGKFVSSLNKSLDYFTKSYEIDNTPNEKGKVKPKYNENNVKMITQMGNYFIYAGQFLNNNGDQKGAYDAFEKYLNMPKLPLFSEAQADSMYKAEHDQYCTVAYYTALLGYQMKDYDKALKHVDFAIADTSSKNKNDLFFIKSQSLLAKKDTAAWLKCVTEAITQLPSNTQFVQNLLYYYNIKNLNNEAIAAAADLVAKAPNNPNAWYSAGCIYLNNAKDFTKAREHLQKALDINPEMYEAQYNMGISYVNELVANKDKFTTNTKDPNYKKDLEAAKEYYRKALPYLEKTRELAPDQPKVWGLALKNVYYNLEMKDKEKEIDSVLASAGIVEPSSNNSNSNTNK